MIDNERNIPQVVLKGVLGLLFLVLFGCGTAEGNKKTLNQPKKASNTNNQVAKKTILCFGNSLTEGYGLKEKESYPALLQQKIDSLGLNYEVVNAGLSGETTTGGKNRLGWVLKGNIDIFILELGANDGLRGIPITETEKNLQEMIDTVKSKLPTTEIVLAGMQIPPNLGQQYTSEFKAIYPRLATKNSIHLIPFLLQNVAGNSKLNQPDGIHPTAEGTKIVVENVWEVIYPLVK